VITPGVCRKPFKRFLLLVCALTGLKAGVNEMLAEDQPSQRYGSTGSGLYSYCRFKETSGEDSGLYSHCRFNERFAQTADSTASDTGCLRGL
jgi:hypothetical protein